MLVLAWKLDAQSMGYFTLQEWLKGMGSLQYVVVFLSLTVNFLTMFHCWTKNIPPSVVVLMKHSSFFRCDSTERLRNSLDYLRSVLNDSTSFKLIYRYAFDFARVSQSHVHGAVRQTHCH